MNPVRVATVFTHRRPDETAAAIHTLLALGRQHGIVLRFDSEETRKHQLEPGAGTQLDAPADPTVDICFALGGDGTILSALRTYAGTGVPVFAVNYGEIGFLATVDREELESGFLRAFAGDFDVLSLPGIELSGGRGQWVAINDVSMHRQPGKRVADLEYWVGTDEIGRVRCDGLVVATPAGSTGYNLANGGPVMAWGVEGFVVSFIAPTRSPRRALVVAPQDVLVIRNRSREEPVDVTVDGRPVCVLPPAEDISARFRSDQGRSPRSARRASTSGCDRSSGGSRPHRDPSGRVVDRSHAARAARREFAADGAGRAAARARASTCSPARRARARPCSRRRSRPAARRPRR